MNYAIIGIVSAVIHVILNHDYFRNKVENNDVNKAFKRYIWAALFYYVTDAFWGIIYDMHIPAAIYIDTVFYYISMALTVLLLCRYVTAYLKLNTAFGRFINWFGIIFGVLEFILLYINHFVHIFFWIDSDGSYHAGTFRYVALYIHVLLCVLIAFQTGFAVKKAYGGMRKRYLTIFLFCIVMTVGIIAQIIFPLLPLYSVGLVFGICIIHTFVTESEKEEQYEVLSSMADIYYSMHVIDLATDSLVEFNARDSVKEIVNKTNGAAEMMFKVMSTVSEDDNREALLEFTDLKTLADRMKGKKSLSAEFKGKHTGWFISMFVAAETDSDGRPTRVIHTTRVIEEDKKQQETLIFKSRTDELTGLYNRRAYEEDIYGMDSIPEEFIYIALDVNGLKVVNDTIGHAAGDELIIGASECLKKVLGNHGKLYRVGGDEFVAIEFVSESKLKEILEEFDNTVSQWSGSLIDSLAISYGFASSEEFPEHTVPQLSIEADKRMYISKTAYYQKKGVDRRGQQNAHRALCETYTKILKINLTDDSYQIVNMLEDEKNTDKGFSDSISKWLQDFGLSGQVHKDDLDEYLKLTGLEYMKDYFSKENAAHIIIYRRKYGSDYKRVMMEMIPANDYSPDNQSLFLYVKNIEK